MSRHLSAHISSSPDVRHALGHAGELHVGGCLPTLAWLWGGLWQNVSLIGEKIRSKPFLSLNFKMRGTRWIRFRHRHYMVHIPYNLSLSPFFFLLSLPPPHHITKSGWDQIQLTWMYIISKLKANLQPCPQWDTQFTTPVTKANCYGYNNKMYHFSKGYFWSTFCIFRKVSIKLFSLLGHTQASCSIQPFFLFLCPIHYASVEVKKYIYFPLEESKLFMSMKE